jgi:hypothetical protein
MLDRKEFPILEFDENKEALISPFDQAKKFTKKFPEKLIITFFKDVIKQLIDEESIEEFAMIKGENDVVVY